jgi:hypothetical protein
MEFSLEYVSGVAMSCASERIQDLIFSEELSIGCDYDCTSLCKSADKCLSGNLSRLENMLFWSDTTESLVARIAFSGCHPHNRGGYCYSDICATRHCRCTVLFAESTIQLQ